MKNCSNKECSQINPQSFSEFYQDKRKKDGKSSRCRTCDKANCAAHYRANRGKVDFRKSNWAKENPEKVFATMLKSKYGITLEHYNKILSDQNNQCKICNKPETYRDCTGKITRLSVDHCHVTNQVRGLLCQRCNRGIGHFDDDPELLRSAANYTENFKNTIKSDI